MSFINNTDLNSLRSEINSLRSKHGLSQYSFTGIGEKAVDTDVNSTIDGLTSLTSSTFISSVNAPTKVVKGNNITATAQASMATEVARLKNICVNHTVHSYYGSDDSSYDSSYNFNKSAYNSDNSNKSDKSDNSNKTVVSDDNYSGCYNSGCDGNKSHMLCPL